MKGLSLLILLYSTSAQGGFLSLAKWIYNDTSAAQCLSLFQSAEVTNQSTRSALGHTFREFRESTLPLPETTSSYAKATITKGLPSLAQQGQVSKRMITVEQALLTSDQSDVFHVTLSGNAAIADFLSQLRTRQLFLEKGASLSDPALNRHLSLNILLSSIVGPLSSVSLNYFLYQAPPPAFLWVPGALVSGTSLYLSIDYFMTILVHMDRSILKLKSFGEAFLKGQQSWAYWSRDTWLPQLFLDLIVKPELITSEQLGQVISFQHLDIAERLVYRRDPLGVDGFYSVDVLFRQVPDGKRQEEVSEMTLVLRTSPSSKRPKSETPAVKEHEVEAREQEDPDKLSTDRVRLFNDFSSRELGRI